jgi:branched-chain amino acid transport system ATP-binding protein
MKSNRAPLLKVENMTHYFGGLRAVHDFNLEINPGEIMGLIGPNGAGKTTVFNLITGVYRPTEGVVSLKGADITGEMPHIIASRGIGRTFQNLRLWRHMTVLEHVMIAHYSQLTYGLFGAFFGTPRRKREEREIEEKAYGLLMRFGVDRYAKSLVGSLSYGAQRRVEMARAMATNPRVLFLDEPTAGMTPDELVDMIKIIREMHSDSELAIVLIEHRMKFVMELCDYIKTLVFGEVIAQGTPEEIRNNQKVIDAYLGKEDIH